MSRPAPPVPAIICLAALSVMSAVYVSAAAWPALAPHVPGAVRADDLVTSLFRQKWDFFTRSTDSVRIRAYVREGTRWRPVPSENVRSLRTSAGFDRSRRAGEWEILALHGAARRAGAPPLTCRGPATAPCRDLRPPPGPTVRNPAVRPQVCGPALLVEDRSGTGPLMAVPVSARC